MGAGALVLILAVAVLPPVLVAVAGLRRNLWIEDDDGVLFESEVSRGAYGEGNQVSELKARRKTDTLPCYPPKSVDEAVDALIRCGRVL